jgi:hypothetical protein
MIAITRMTAAIHAIRRLFKFASTSSQRAPIESAIRQTQGLNL